MSSDWTCSCFPAKCVCVCVRACLSWTHLTCLLQFLALYPPRPVLASTFTPEQVLSTRVAPTPPGRHRAPRVGPLSQHRPRGFCPRCWRWARCPAQDPDTWSSSVEFKTFIHFDFFLLFFFVLLWRLSMASGGERRPSDFLPTSCIAATSPPLFPRMQLLSLLFLADQIVTEPFGGEIMWKYALKSCRETKLLEKFVFPLKCFRPLADTCSVVLGFLAHLTETALKSSYFHPMEKNLSKIYIYVIIKKCPRLSRHIPAFIFLMCFNTASFLLQKLLQHLQGPRPSTSVCFPSSQWETKIFKNKVK